MKLYTCTNFGRYVAGAAVILARDKTHAMELLRAELGRAGLSGDADALLPEHLQRIPQTQPTCRVLLDGDY